MEENTHGLYPNDDVIVAFGSPTSVPEPPVVFLLGFSLICLSDLEGGGL